MLICLDQRTGTGCGTHNQNGILACSSCGRSLRFALEVRDPGSIVGAYRIVRIIGVGGFGVVYQADVAGRPGLQGALKETFDPTSIRSFQSEFAVLRQLQHPNLPSYYDMFEAAGNGYLVMEYVPGQSLEDVLARRGTALPESQVLRYAIQLCTALSYLALT